MFSYQEAQEEQLHSQSEVLELTPIMDVVALEESKRLGDKGLDQYLEQEKITWIAPLGDGTVLFNHADIKVARALLTKIAPFLIRRKLRPRLRPASRTVVSFLRGSRDLDADGNKRKIRTADIGFESDREKSDRSSVQQLLDNVVKAARKRGSSDIHIETDKEKNTAKIRFRIDGDAIEQTSDYLRWEERQAVAMASMIISYEAHSGSGSVKGTFDENKPKNGSFEVKIDGEQVKLRYSHQPKTPPGLSIVMRIVTGDKDGRIPSFKELGYSLDEQAIMERAFRYPHGMVLFTGPTGSGKSTAMAAGISRLSPTLKIVSYEDPVEAMLPNVIQVQIGDSPDTSLPAYSRSVLRQDPDVIIYGEIWDEEVMKESTKQANTGHLVISTLHTNSAPEAIQRMVDLGCDWSRVSSPSLIRAIAAQRLVKKLCSHCSLPLKSVIDNGWATNDDYRVWEHFSKTYPDKLGDIRTTHRGLNHCSECNGNGTSGRLPILEIILMDDKGRDFIRNQDIEGWIKYLHEQGWRNMGEKALDRIFQGQACPLIIEKTLETPFGIKADVFNYDEFSKRVESLASQRIKDLSERVVTGNAG